MINGALWSFKIHNLLMSSEDVSNKFGTLKGVYIPSALTIFGVIMYLRMGWMVAHVGLAGSLAIITISSLITFMTALSIAATATNMRVGAGGAYYMISRSFGIETGAAIGIPLFFAQSLGIAFYISGFTESVAPYLPHITPELISAITVTLLFLLSYFSADLTLKLQSFIFLLIIASLVSFFMGSPEKLTDPHLGQITKQGFWVVFAVIFPAVTGIEAGLAMSGDLKDPSKSLPTGTLAAVITGYVVYMIIPIFLFYNVEMPFLYANTIMISYAAIGALVTVGLWGSTLSSAIGALLGGPRTLQALAKDRILFSFFSKTHGAQNLPRRATVVSYFIALMTLMVGDLNSIASVLSMFFLTSYGLINLATLFENLMKNPSWRPGFKTHWLFSLLGGMLCFIIMLLISAGSALIAFACVALIYTWTKKRNLGRHWSDIRRGMLVNIARDMIYRLDDYKQDARSWRPNIVVFSGSPNQRFPLIDFGQSISGGKSFLTVCSILSNEHRDFDRKKSMEESIRTFIQKKDVQALTEVHFAASPFEGAVSFSESYGLGGLKPNLLVFGESDDDQNKEQFASMICDLYNLRKNIVILRNHTQNEDGPTPTKSEGIHVWWGRQAQNANLMLALAFLVQQNSDRKKSKIFLKTMVHAEDAEKAQNELEVLSKNVRIPVKTEIIEQLKGTSFFEAVQKESAQADLMFMGMRPPREGESTESFSKYYQTLLSETEHFPPTAMVMSSEEIPFKEIFEGI